MNYKILRNLLFFVFFFRTQVVGDNSASANDLKTCIDEWFESGTAATQSLSVGGTTLMVILMCS